MAVTMISQFPATTDQYDEVERRLDLDNNSPDGLIIHTAARVGDEIRVIDVWESAEQFETFNNERLMGTATEVMGEPPADAPPPSPPEVTELHNVYRP